MSLVGVGQETVEITRRGWYAVGDARVSIEEATRRAIEATRLYRPGDYDGLPLEELAAPASVQVTEETTAEAARRLAGEGVAHVAALNFASAKNPGGGFLGGAK